MQKAMAALYSAVSQSLVSLPAASIFQLLGTLKMPSMALTGFSAKLGGAPPTPMPHWFLLGWVTAVSIFLKSSIFLGALSSGTPAASNRSFRNMMTLPLGCRWTGMAYILPSTTLDRQ